MTEGTKAIKEALRKQKTAINTSRKALRKIIDKAEDMDYGLEQAIENIEHAIGYLEDVK